ncbi:MAG: OmpA family protein [Bacteroidales bacterium]|nr:OmpA family protein [Bacteroidales bacterium]
MKRNLIFLLLLTFVFTFVAYGEPAKPKKPKKPKYKELAAMYQKCTDDLNYTTSEKNDCENKNNLLTTEIAGLKVQIERLREDTSTLGRRIRIIERNLDKTKADYDELLKSFTDQSVSKNALLAEKEARLNELQSILDQKDAEVKALKNKVADALKGFEDKGLTVHEKDGKVYVSLDNELLFASGSWDIDNKGKEALGELATVLASDPGINVAIEGHTDNVPFKGSGNIKDNWDLSVMRSTAVVREILKNKDINPQRLTASGRSEYVPIDFADTREARAKNRRTEIILTPKLDELFQLINN